MNKKSYVYGFHAVQSLLKTRPEKIIHLLAIKSHGESKLESILQEAKAQHISIEYINREKMDRLTETTHHQNIAAYCVSQPPLNEQSLPNFLSNLSTQPLFLILDGVQDPHNLGACFRSADAAKADAIIAPKDRAVSLTAVVSKVASGAAETVPFFQVTNLVRSIEILKAQGVWVYGADEKASDVLFNTDLSGPVAIILGSEGKGLRRLTREHCDGLIKIPMYGQVSSLNVSVAAGIVLFEVVRQRMERGRL